MASTPKSREPRSAGVVIASACTSAHALAEGEDTVTLSTTPGERAAAAGVMLRRGERLGAHMIVEFLGRGGCSTVYVAEHIASGERVAIKVLHEVLAMSTRQVRRFVQEAQAVQRIRHPGIVVIHESGYLDDGRPYLAMELVQGRSLTALLQERGRLTPREALALLAPLCDALGSAHAAGIVHRDIKASNIMVVDGVEPAIKILDFGVAKLTSDADGDALATSIGRVLGTPYCMAPEQILGHPVDARTDIYALGALLFRMLTGRYPFVSDDLQVVVHMHLDAAPPRPSLFAPAGAAIDEVVQQAMAKDPEHRFGSAGAFLDAFRRAVQAEEQELSAAAPALGIYLQCHVAGDIDDALFERLMLVLDAAEACLRDHGLQIALQTGEAVLGVLLAGPDADADAARALELGRELDAVVRAQRGADTRLAITVCVHAASAQLTAAPGGERVIGGAITHVSSWAPGAALDELVATMDVMGDVMGAQPGSRFVRVPDPADPERG